MSDELSEIRWGVEKLNTALALHDQKVEAHVSALVDQQERLATAVEKIGEATIAIRALAERMPANGKNGGSIFPDVLKWLWRDYPK